MPTSTVLLSPPEGHLKGSDIIQTRSKEQLIYQIRGMLDKFLNALHH